MATIDGGVMAAFRSARAAYDANERVLELDPSRADAGSIIGTYRYFVSALSMPVRWIAYISGFGGGAIAGCGWWRPRQLTRATTARTRTWRCCCSTTVNCVSTMRSGNSNGCGNAIHATACSGSRPARRSYARSAWRKPNWC